MKTVLAGYADVDLTPGGECDLTGFVGHRQPALGIRMALQGRILWMGSGRARALVAVCDLLGFSLADSRRIERAMAAAAAVPVNNVLLSCTHTHSAPMSMPLGLVGRHQPGYVTAIRRHLVRAARRAAADGAPVTSLRFGQRTVPELGFFRCAKNEPGRDRWPGRLSAIGIERQSRPPITLVHLGIHPYMLGPKNRWIHPDYPGEVCTALSTATGGQAIVLPGCGADVSPAGGMGTSFSAVRRFGQQVAQIALATLAAGRALPLAAPRCRRVCQRISFDPGSVPPNRRGSDPEQALAALAAGADDRPLRNTLRWRAGLQAGKWHRALSLPIHLLELGSLVLAGLPTEVFHDTGADLAAAFPMLDLLTLSQTGGDIGYLPRAFAYRHATYEAAEAHEWYDTAGPAAPRAEPAVRRAITRAITQMTTG